MDAFKSSLMNRGWIMGWIAWLVCCAGAIGGWVPIPVHETRQGPAGGFDMGRFEVMVGDFVRFLNATGGEGFSETVQIGRRANRRFAAARGASRQAVAEVTPAEAEAYGRWLSRETGRIMRLPKEAEWETAARGGVDGAPYPWGWGGPPEDMAQFDASGPASRVGRFPPNGFGLHDMAGNLYEWCAPEPGLPSGQRVARGGGWPERDPRRLRVDHRQPFPADYRGRDVGFRLLREWTTE